MKRLARPVKVVDEINANILQIVFTNAIFRMTVPVLQNHIQVLEKPAFTLEQATSSVWPGIHPDHYDQSSCVVDLDWNRPVEFVLAFFACIDPVPRTFGGARQCPDGDDDGIG